MTRPSHADAATAPRRAGLAESPAIQTLAVLNSFIGGGAERQMMLLLKHLDRSRFELTLCVLAMEGPLVAEVPDDIPVITLAKRSRADLPRLVARLRRVLRDRRPEVVLSKVDYANVVATLAVQTSGLRTPLVLGEESAPSAQLETMTHPRLRHALLRWSYRRAGYVTAPSAGVVSDLRDNFKVHGPAFHVIPNMVDFKGIQEAARWPSPHAFSQSQLPLIVAAGRLQRAKGQTDLVRAIGLLRNSHPCNLLLLGDGEDKSHLEALVRDLQIGDHVALTGFAANPFAIFAQADILVSPSHFESFGNVLIEAMALGVPVVSTRVPFGPEAIIADGKTGLFARPRDPQDLAKKIALLLDDPDLGRRMGDHARRTAKHYDVRTVIIRYHHLLEEAAGREKTTPSVSDSFSGSPR